MAQHKYTEEMRATNEAFEAMWDSLPPGTKLHVDGQVLVRMKPDDSHYIYPEFVFNTNTGEIVHFSHFFISSSPEGLERLKKAIKTPT